MTSGILVNHNYHSYLTISTIHHHHDQILTIPTIPLITTNQLTKPHQVLKILKIFDNPHLPSANY